MRSLTPAEARVIQALLAAVPGGETDRARRSGVPRTTYQTIRRRVLVDGWVQERYVPSPSAVQATSVRFWLAQPFAERVPEVVSWWRANLGTVLLWASPETVLAVSFEVPRDPTHRPPERTHGEMVPAGWLRRSWTFVPTSDGSGAPVYFDYEGAWSRAIGATSSISYPQSLPVAVDGTTRPSAGDLRAVLARPFTPSLGDRLTLRFSASHLSPRQRRLVEHGWVSHRQFPSLAKIPPFRGRQDERVVFTTGLLQTGWGLRQFLDRLYRDHRVAPFLAIEDSGRVLLAMLSPAPDRVPQPRPAVQLFQDALREIEILREPIRTLDPVIDHRYDRLFFG
jgi:hypothetical protein